ncbi:cytochrome P450 family protein [Streptomyces sp. 049-1]|uniref:cytochrome P450 family protein n=1 Tax=Streptomyces sp. 049-1 TaxID=2789264 RepID=UPI00397EC56D
MVLHTGVPAWVVTGYAEGRAVLSDPRIVRGGPSNGPYTQERPQLSAAINSHVLVADPPDHSRLRTLVSMAFTRRRIELLEPRVEQLCAELLDDLEDRLARDGEVDLITAFAEPLPLSVMLELLGIAAHDRAALRGWCEVLAAGRLVDVDAFTEAASHMLDFLHDLLSEKRARPAADLLSALIHAHDGEDRLTDDELTSMVYMLIHVGHETTMGLIANGTRALLLHPEQWTAVGADQSLVVKAVEEALRFDSPAQIPVPGIAAEDLDIGGTAVAQGNVVVVSLIGANRDPQRFTDPDVFDISRDRDGREGTTGHMSFGHGIHYCLGAPLARMEGRIALGMLARRLPDLELAGPASSLRRVPSLLLNRLEALRVRRSTR